MNSIEICGICINIHDGPIGLSLSGGADSALLAYILMKNCRDPIHFYTVASKEKGLQSPIHAARIINKCVELTGKTNIEHHIKYVDSQTRRNLLVYLDTAGRNRQLSAMYTATTSFPEEDILNGFKSTLPENILARRGSSVLKSIYSIDGFFYNPFINYDKKKISELYSTLQIMDTIYPLSRSCESTITLDRHCLNCWWCEERLWAFGIV